MDLSCNFIKELRSGWRCPSSVRRLNLSNNQIETFTIAPMPELESLNLSWNLFKNLMDILEKLKQKIINPQLIINIEIVSFILEKKCKTKAIIPTNE